MAQVRPVNEKTPQLLFAYRRKKDLGKPTQSAFMEVLHWIDNPMYALGARPAVRLPAVVLELCQERSGEG